ncbi:dolichyldiphosphatase 1-like [Pollicipes pollicipes]|uniref:dolichyldiphosphatase 1-like n=1 Tax=Pollicipes pollicipes TaxID=41117 RepID=UPI001884B71C|nr:dolichyldiphosphatase 1-like [Pollicipes pollicipes]XP_037082928.1 dolichyldiphosphatase 1-like [Pollicipes pollicipes]XP_037082941.1 dolichyldiphosphatase 1-like [Pollicipes pollicipes]
MSEGVREWHEFALTHVEYPVGDNVGKVLCLFSLLPQALIVSFVTLVMFKRDLHTIFFFIGVCACEVLNIILKHTLQQARPSLKRTNYSLYGMPSSHSQLSWFIAGYLTLFLLIRLHHVQTSSLLMNMWKHMAAVLCCVCAALVSFSRVYLEYHSWWQVVCGAGVGVAFGVLWFVFVHWVCTPFFPQIVQWRICELLLICDTSLIPCIMWFEYANIRQEARARQRRLHLSAKSQ